MTPQDLFDLLVRAYDVPPQRLEVGMPHPQDSCAIVLIDGAIEVYVLPSETEEGVAECGVFLPGKNQHNPLAHGTMRMDAIGQKGGPFHEMLDQAVRTLVTMKLRLDRAHSAADALAWRMAPRVQEGVQR